LERDQIKQIVTEVLAELLAQTLAKTTEKQSERWIALDKAWEELGYPSYSALYKDVNAGVFRVGKELRDRRKPGAKIARYQINIAVANKRLMEDPSKRRAV
jgi:hypothetical protein